MPARSKRSVALSTSALVLPIALACAEGGDKVNAGGQPQAGQLTGPQNPGLDQNPNANPAGPKPPVDPNTIVTDNRILDVVAKINAKAIGISACSGELGIRIKLQVDEKDTNFKMFEVPSDTVKCMIIGELGLKKILEGDGTPKPKPPKEGIVVERGVMRFVALADGYFPKKPRPFLPAFLSASPMELRNINVTENVEAVDFVKKPNDPPSPGVITVKTVDYKKTFRHEPMNRDFKEVYDFEIKNEGFKDFNRLSTFLFDRMFMRISLKPFAILRFEMSTSVSKLIAGAGDALGGGQGGSGGLFGGLGGLLGGSAGGAAGGGTGGGLLGGAGGGLVSVLGNLIQVHIEADIIKQEGLPKPGEEEVDDDIQIGGKDKKDDKDDE